MQPATAHTILCDACGGRIPLQGVPASVVCPFCRREQAIPEARRAELASYQRDVGGALGRASSEQSQADNWNRWYGGRGARSKYAAWAAPVIFLAMLVPMVGMAFGMQAWMESGRPMPAYAMTLMGVVPFGFFIVVYGVYVVWYYGGRKKEGARGAAAATATCPQCGAPNQLAPGQVLERCSHCGTSLLPSTTLMRAGLGAAEAAVREAAMRRYRAEREGMASLMRMSLGGGSPYVIIGSFLPVTVGAGIAFTVDAVQNGNKEPGGLLAIWILASVNVGLMVLVYLWRRHVQRIWTTLLEDASRPFGHQILAGLDEMVAWLNGYWAGPVPLEDLSAGSHFQAAALSVGELAGLIVLNPTARSEGTPVYASVFVAAWIPAMHGSGVVDEAALESCRATLERWGFRLSLSEAGLSARGDTEAVKRLKRVAGAGTGLAGIVTAMGDAARVVGAVGVERLG